METNGHVVKVSELVEQARDRLATDDGSLLRDMSEQYPFLRSFLIGGERNGQVWPAGQIFVYRETYGITVKLSIRTLGIEVTYRDSDASSLLELIENDLELNHTQWELNYKEKQREENKRLAAVE